MLAASCEDVEDEQLGTTSEAALGYKFCPAPQLGASGTAKMIVGAVGFDRATAIRIAQDHCRQRGLFFPDTTQVLATGDACGQLAISDHGPWLETAGIIGALDPRDGFGNVWPLRALDKQGLAKLIVVSKVVRSGRPTDGFCPGGGTYGNCTTTDKAITLAWQAAESNAGYFADAGLALPEYQLWVKAMGAWRMADGVVDSRGVRTFGVNAYIAKGGLAKLALRAVGITPSNMDWGSNFAHRWFIDSSTTGPDWQPYIDYFGYMGKADGIPPWSSCPAGVGADPMASIGGRVCCKVICEKCPSNHKDTEGKKVIGELNENWCNSNNIQYPHDCETELLKSLGLACTSKGCVPREQGCSSHFCE